MIDAEAADPAEAADRWEAAMRAADIASTHAVVDPMRVDTAMTHVPATGPAAVTSTAGATSTAALRLRPCAAPESAWSTVRTRCAS